jgi:hypothetical protein
MPPRRAGPLSSSGFRGVRARPAGNFYAEIRVTGFRLSLGTFATPHEVARVYDAAAWRLGRPRRDMNFDDVNSRAEAEMVAPPPCLVTAEEKHRHRQRQRRLAIAEADERAMEAWRKNFPQDVADEMHFYAEKKAQREAEKAAKKARKAFIMAQLEGETTISDDDPRWDDLWSTTDVSLSADEE